MEACDELLEEERVELVLVRVEMTGLHQFHQRKLEIRVKRCCGAGGEQTGRAFVKLQPHAICQEVQGGR